MYECRIKEKKFPEISEIVIAKTFSIDDNILNMKLTEYNNIVGLVLNSELSKKKVKSIHQITKVGNTEVCQVLGVDNQRGYIDLSLKCVGEKDKKECLNNAKKNKLSYQIMQKVANLANITIEKLYNDFGYEMIKEYGSLYRYLAKGKKNPTVFKENKEYGEYFIDVINEQFKPSTYKVKGDIEVASHIGGVNGIKKAFENASVAYPNLEMVLLKSPTYSITGTGDDKEGLITKINNAFEIIRKSIEKENGTFHISVLPKVYGEKNKHMLFEDEFSDSKENDDSEDSDDV